MKVVRVIAVRTPGAHGLVNGLISFIQRWRAIRRARRDNARILEILADTLERQGRFSEAARVLESIIRLQPGSRADLHRRAGDIYINVGQPDAAMRCYRHALKLSGFATQETVLIAHHLAVAGYLDEAVDVYDRASSARRSELDALQAGEQPVQVLPHYWVERIGHLAFLDSYVKMLALGWVSPRHVMLLAPADRVANQAYLDKWRPFLTVVTDPDSIERLGWRAQVFENYYFSIYRSPAGVPIWWIRAAWAAQHEWDRQGRRPLLTLSQRERDRGERRLREMGIPEGAWIVCMHARESGFHADKADPSQAWRDSDVERYDEAIAAIVARGGWIVRMGDELTAPLRVRYGVVDYAHSEFKSDWMDVFLCATCRFFIATNSGLGIVPSTFGVPAIAVDYAPLANELYVKQGIFLPKLYWLEREGRFLSFDESMAAPIGYTHRGQTFAGLRVRNNTPAEIAELVMEMIDGLDGRLQDDPECDALQARYDAVRRMHGVVSTARVGRAFLKRFSGLLPSEVAVRDAPDTALDTSRLGLPSNDVDVSLRRAEAYRGLGNLAVAQLCAEHAITEGASDETAHRLVDVIATELRCNSPDDGAEAGLARERRPPVRSQRRTVLWRSQLPRVHSGL